MGGISSYGFFESNNRLGIAGNNNNHKYNNYNNSSSSSNTNKNYNAVGAA